MTQQGRTFEGRHTISCRHRATRRRACRAELHVPGSAWPSEPVCWVEPRISHLVRHVKVHASTRSFQGYGPYGDKPISHDHREVCAAQPRRASHALTLVCWILILWYRQQNGSSWPCGPRRWTEMDLLCTKYSVLYLGSKSQSPDRLQPADGPQPRRRFQLFKLGTTSTWNCPGPERVPVAGPMDSPALSGKLPTVLMISGLQELTPAHALG